MSMDTHWADIYAQKVMRERGAKERYVCASGITPSGTVHIGNFREIISVDLVVRSLRDAGKDAHFLYSWDDFDVFRKVPANVPDVKAYEQYLRRPIVDVPDPYGRAENYARGNELDIEKILGRVGIHPQYLYQAQQYRAGTYAEGMRRALEKRREIMDILNKHRSDPLPDSWYPLSVFSEFTGKDTTVITSWDGEWSIGYRCEETGKESTLDLRTSSNVKLLWRIDWPMRWKFENVDFEPAGKDHHSQGGSFDTARDIVSRVYDGAAPVTFQYDFVRLKGGSGKLSSSSGEVVSLEDVLSVYQPEIVRYLFAGTRPNAEFAISFDLDVLKIYEDYDRCERIYFGQEQVGDARKQKEARIYELSQVAPKPPTRMPMQAGFRNLCSIVQTYGGSIPDILSALSVPSECEQYVAARSLCAWNWVRQHAPDEFRFSLQDAGEQFWVSGDDAKAVGAAFALLRDAVASRWNELSDKDMNDLIYSCARDAGADPARFFVQLYLRITGKEKGPRLGSFFKILGKERTLEYLRVQ